MAWFATQAQGSGFFGVEDDVSPTTSRLLWSDPAPKNYLYPWRDLRFPLCKTEKETKQLVEHIKKKGNDSFGRGDHYDALWKYEHALLLCRSYPSLKSETAAIHSNIAAACLKLGDAGRLDLLDPYQFPLSYVLWYTFTQHHATEAIDLTPEPKVAHKAHYRRADSLHKLIKSTGGIGQIMPHMLGSNPYMQVVYDHVRCFELQDPPDPKVLCDAIQIAVDNGQTKFLPVLKEKHIRSGFSSNLLKELIYRSDCTLDQVNFVLYKLKFNTKKIPHFDTSSFPAAPILQKKFANGDLLETLMKYGMIVRWIDVESASHLLPREKLESLRSYMTRLAPTGSTDGFPKMYFEDLKKEGNKLFAEGMYEQALGVYFKALKYCQKYNMPEEMALVRSNCALACLKLQLYSDAYSHCCECVKMDPKMHKGYFRRAEALKAMLASPHESKPPGTINNVIEDYLHCHQIESNLEAYCAAFLLSNEHKRTHLLPKFQESDVSSGFSTKVMRHLFAKRNLTEKQLKFLLYKLPEPSIAKPYDTAQISVLVVLEVTTDHKILHQMFELGMHMKDKDLTSSVEIVPLMKTDTFELLIDKCPLSTRTSMINEACVLSMNVGKVPFIELLIKHGARPPVDDLIDVVGFTSNPIIQDYLTRAGSGSMNMNTPLYREFMESAMGGMDWEHMHEKNTVFALNNEAKSYFKEGDIMSALGRYDKAMEICNKYALREEAASIHCNCAHLLLQMDRLYEAYQHADSCIKLNPMFAKAYIRRAEALKRALHSGRFQIPSNLTVENVIDDYLHGHELKSNVKAFGEALLLAVENDKRSMVLCSRRLSVDFCNKLLVEILPRAECKQAHLQFLLCEMWNEKSIDISQVKINQLIVNKGITDTRLFTRFVELGLSLKKGEVKKVIHLLKPEQQPLFKIIVPKCRVEDLDELCQEAISAKKISLVLLLVEHGAKLPGNGQELLLQALKTEDYDGAKALVKKFTKATLNKLDLGVLIDTNLVRCPELIEMLIDAGVSPNGNAKAKPLVVVMSQQQFLSLTKKIEVACLLIKKGADCDGLCAISKNSVTTALHVATEVALKSDGDTRLIEAVSSSLTFKPGKLSNEKGESPFHLSVKPHLKKELSTCVLKALIATKLVDPSKKDQSGKRAIDLLPKKDSRIKLLEDASEQFKPGATSQSKKKRNKKKTAPKRSSPEIDLDKVLPVGQCNQEKPVKEKKRIVPPVPEVKKSYGEMSMAEKLEEHIARLMKKNSEYFAKGSMTVEAEKSGMAVESSDNIAELVLTKSKQNIETDKKQQKKTSPAHAVQCVVAPSTQLTATDPNNVSFLLRELVGLDFDELPWEVEVTAKVIKYFKDTKKTPLVERVRAAKTMYSLAEGNRGEHLSKRVSHDASLHLFRAKTTKGSRLLWERAISYSSKLTGPSPIPVYTHVIRVWEIVSDHDNLDHAISHCVEQIEQSHKRGHQASIRWKLQPDQGNAPHTASSAEKIRGKEKIDIPTRFLLRNFLPSTSQYHFVPAASTKENEYNVTTFYSFDTITSKSMLLGTRNRRDFPFKEWQKEHEIIKLDPKEAILLLGRSGTGKTTCCLYRLWNEFKDFWNPESPLFGIKRRRRQLISPVVLQASLESSESDEYSDGSSDESSDEWQIDVDEQSAVQLLSASIAEELHADEASKPSSKQTLSGLLYDTSQCVDTKMIEEDIHQVFVTKNYVLCHQMKTRFYDLAAAHDFLDSHMVYEREEHPNNFGAFHNHAFPLFLTARQFYILLDNSLGREDTFFKRDQDGNLLVKILSADYDHEDDDTLLDLESSDSEDEDIVTVGATVETVTGKEHTEKWREVTALYFKEKVWPNISYQCGVTSKDFDPLLVWIEIQSFIKGSELALRKGSPLSFEEYRTIGNRMAPNFSNHREKIYALFKKYQRYQQNQRHKNYLFDECDLILHLYKRLKATPDVPWSIHSLYIDEVQDFTQAELAIFIHCCRDPNSMFFTGDTAQSIMRGIAFRFKDLRSCFHRIHEKIPLVNVPQEPYKLTINFRSHSGILKLAGSIIDLISEYFKDSIDHLPDDEGMFQGPTPVLLESCKVDDLALLLSANKRERSAIEFGAHQAIIVQSREAKEKLPDILKGAIVMTIFEAKGLEFDDVLLYNFFADSMMDEKGWRVIASYLKMSQHSVKICNKDMLPGSTIEPRSCSFDPKVHKSLNAELKYLYTAITRAKCNLWIYDSDRKNRLPMFDYWYKRNLVKVVTADQTGKKEYMLIFASNSTSEQWKIQGDNFKEKHLWEQAVLCYERAGEENKYLAIEASAYLKMQQARLQKPALYLEAALRFLECDKLHHSIRYLTGAALCFKSARPPRYQQAASLYEKLGETGKAAQVYLKSKDIKNFARLKESRGEHNAVVRALLGKNFMKKREALAKADEYEKAGIILDADLSTAELSYSCAKFYSSIKDEKTLREVLKYMPDLKRRAKFLKEAELYDEAFRVYVEHKQYSDAFRLVSAHGGSNPEWFESGLNLASNICDKNSHSVFVFQRAKVELMSGKKSEASVKELSSLKNSGDRLVRAQACLLLGMMEQDAGLCKTACGTFKLLKHKVGELEAFNQVQELTDESIQSLLDCCHLSKVVSNTLDICSDINKEVQDATKFYGLQKIGNFYLTPPDQDIWIGEALLKCVCKESRYDADGMLKLNADDTRDVIAEHVSQFSTKWLEKFQLEKRLQPTFKLHDKLWNDRTLSREYSQQEVSSKALQEYLQTCLYMLQYRQIIDLTTDPVVCVLLAVFSPQVAIYLPQRLQEEHVNTVRRSINSHAAFRSWLKSTVIKPSKEVTEKVQIDKWLMAWRACCITTPDYKLLFNALAEIEPQNVKQDSRPVGFVYWKKEKKYYHLFRIWLNSCVAIRENAQPLWAARLAIDFFLGEIAQSQNVSISVMNAVDILTLHSTALLAMLAQSNALQNRTSSCTVPMCYKHTVQLFNHMNTVRRTDKKEGSKGHKWLLAACAEEVSNKRNYGAIFKDCMMLLIRSIGLLLGTSKYAPRFCILKFALQRYPNSDATRHCLILTLVLFGNLSMIRARDTPTFHQKISSILKRSLSKNAKMPKYVEMACKATMSQTFSDPDPQQVFELVEKLLSVGSNNHDLAKLVYKRKGSYGKVEFVHIPTMPPPPVVAPPVVMEPPMMTPQQSGPPMVPEQPTPMGVVAPQHVYHTNPSVPQDPSMFHQMSSPTEQAVLPLSVPQHQGYIPQQSNWPASAIHVQQPTANVSSGFVQQGTQFEALPHHPGMYSHPHYPQPGQVVDFQMQYGASMPQDSSDIPFNTATGGNPVFEHAVQNPIGAERRQHLQEQLPQPVPVMPSDVSQTGTETIVDSYLYSRDQPNEPVVANVVASYTRDQLKELAAQSVYNQPQATVVGGPEGVNISSVGELPTSPGASFSTDVDTGHRVYHYPSPPVLPTSIQPQQLPATAAVNPAMYRFELPDDFENQPELGEDDSVEYFNQQDDFEFALTAGTLPNEVPQIFDPEMVDPNIVSPNFCNACGVSLKSEDYMYQFGDDVTTDTESAENYFTHVNSEHHRVNLVACKRYMNTIDNVSGNELYPQLRHRMNILFGDCERLKQRSGTDKLDRVMDNLQEEIQKCDEDLSQLSDQRRWRQAIETMIKMTDSVDRLLKASFEKYHRVYNEVAAHEKAERERLAEDIVEQEQFAKDVHVESKLSSVSGAQNAAEAAMRTHDQKLQSRQKKRLRHRTTRGVGAP